MTNSNSTITVKAIRTDYHDNSKKRAEIEITLEVFISVHDHKPWVRIGKGAVTGFESLAAVNVQSRNRIGWSACAGTYAICDSLYVPAESMQQIYDWLKELKHV